MHLTDAGMPDDDAAPTLIEMGRREWEMGMKLDWNWDCD